MKKLLIFVLSCLLASNNGLLCMDASAPQQQSNPFYIKDFLKGALCSLGMSATTMTLGHVIAKKTNSRARGALLGVIGGTPLLAPITREVVDSSRGSGIAYYLGYYAGYLGSLLGCYYYLESQDRFEPISRYGRYNAC